MDAEPNGCNSIKYKVTAEGNNLLRFFCRVMQGYDTFLRDLRFKNVKFKNQGAPIRETVYPKIGRLNHPNGKYIKGLACLVRAFAEAGFFVGNFF